MIIVNKCIGRLGDFNDMRYLIWGTGKRAEELYFSHSNKIQNYDIKIIGFIDNRRDKEFFYDKEVYLPHEIPNLAYDYIDIWVINGKEEIERQIKDDVHIPDNKIQNMFIEILDKMMSTYEKPKETERYKKPSLELLSVCVDLYAAEQWYKYAYKNFKNRKHCYLAYKWISENVDKGSKILEVACGAGGILYHLYQDGFHNLAGYDVDRKAIDVARKLTDITNANIELYIDNAMSPNVNAGYDVIVWVNGMYYLSDYSLDQFYENHLPMVKNNGGGYILFDMIDIKYNDIPQNEYNTQCWNKDGEKRPSEYKIRMSKDEVIEVSKKYKAEIIEYYFIDSIVPHDVYVFKV